MSPRGDKGITGRNQTHAEEPEPKVNLKGAWEETCCKYRERREPRKRLSAGKLVTAGIEQDTGWKAGREGEAA